MEDRGSSPFASVCRRFGCVTGQRDGTAHVSFPEPGTSVRGSRAETAPTETRFPGADGGFRTKREGMKHPLRVRLSGPSGCGTDPRLAVARWTCLPLRIALFFGRRTAAPFGVGRSVGSAGCGCLGSRSSNGKVCQARRRRAPSGSPDDSASAGNRATPPGGRSVVIRHLAPDRQEPPQAETTVLQWVGSPWEHRATRRADVWRFDHPRSHLVHPLDVNPASRPREVSRSRSNLTSINPRSPLPPGCDAQPGGPLLTDFTAVGGQSRRQRAGALLRPLETI